MDNAHLGYNYALVGQIRHNSSQEKHQELAEMKAENELERPLSGAFEFLPHDDHHLSTDFELQVLLSGMDFEDEYMNVADQYIEMYGNLEC